MSEEGYRIPIKYFIYLRLAVMQNFRMARSLEANPRFVDLVQIRSTARPDGGAKLLGQK
jgi:hypothetical protein